VLTRWRLGHQPRLQEHGRHTPIRWSARSGDLVDLAERSLGSPDLHLCNANLWAKYAGAIDYDQVHHRDFVNHSLVVPNRVEPGRQMTSFVLLSHVTRKTGPPRWYRSRLARRVPTGRRAVTRTSLAARAPSPARSPRWR
jgi:hypothetical protein